MPRAYKLIQNGVVTYAPANPKIKAHFESHNQDLMRFNKSKAAENMVQVFDATEEEYLKYVAPKVSEKRLAKVQTTADENTLLREQLQAMQAQMMQMQGNMLLFLAEKSASAPSAVEGEDKPKRTYNKKQKDENNSNPGEAETNEPTEA